MGFASSITFPGFVPTVLTIISYDGPKTYVEPKYFICRRDVTEEALKAQIAARMAAGKIVMIAGKYSLPPRPE